MSARDGAGCRIALRYLELITALHPGEVATAIALQACVSAGLPAAEVERRKARVLVGSAAPLVALLDS